MLRAAFVPMAWIKADISAEALRTLIAISSFADRTTGECWPSNRQLVGLLNRCERSIRSDISEIENAGLISIEGGLGKNRSFRIESEEWFQKRTPKRPDNQATSCRDETPSTRQHPAGSDETTRQSTVINPATYRHQPGNILPGANKNTSSNISKNSSGGSESVTEESKPTARSATTTTTTRTDIEPFESGLPATLPIVRNGVAPFRNRTVEIVATKFKPETAARMLEVLGHESDQFKTKITQEQADAGFPDWVLEESAKNKTPVKLAFHLLKTAWRPGWVDPRRAQKELEDELMRRIEALQ